jgi:hypothetical protein
MMRGSLPKTKNFKIRRLHRLRRFSVKDSDYDSAKRTTLSARGFVSPLAPSNLERNLRNLCNLRIFPVSSKTAARADDLA